MPTIPEQKAAQQHHMRPGMSYIVNVLRDGTWGVWPVLPGASLLVGGRVISINPEAEKQS